MKKVYLPFFALLTCLGMQAQTIFEENFETSSTVDAASPIGTQAGWTTINGYSGSTMKFNWFNKVGNPEKPDINGAHCAAIEASRLSAEDEGCGPREEILLSPEISLDGTCQLQFSFVVSPMHYIDNSRYDLQVRVVEDGNIDGAETIFSLHNEKMLRESGITQFPILGWDVQTARIDLSDFKDSKVKLAFVFKMFREIGNSAYVDDISVHKFTPPTAPVPSLSLTRYDFKQMYVGEKRFSDVFTLTNTGTDGLKINSIELPNGVTSTLKTGSVDLLRNQSVDFRLLYTASMTSASAGNVVLHTTGGDATIAIAASKELVPEGLTFEGFEEYFPAAGWVSDGWGPSSSIVLEGERSASCDGGYGRCTLRSPKLDLTDGGSVTFTYFNYYTSDDPDSAPEYDITLEVSYDGGSTWTTKWTSDYMYHLNNVYDETVDLGLGTDESYIRWCYPPVESDDEGAFPHSNFVLDRVLLPNVVGADGTPGRTTLLSPENGAEQIYPKNVLLTWGPAQFAKGYKLYVGTNTECNDLVDGQDLGKAYRYELPQLDYETTYRWKVVAYNDKGDATSTPTWRFTTQKDASVAEYPYEENFSADRTLPVGWKTETTDYSSYNWSTSPYLPTYSFGGNTYPVVLCSWLNTGKTNFLESPEFKLPDDRSMAITFVWGDYHPLDLLVDASGLVKKNNVEPNNGASITSFQVLADGEWHTLSSISENPNADDKKYWINEKIDLAQFRGKKVQFRWFHESFSTKDKGAALAHIVVAENKDYTAGFNVAEWNAGKVNYNKSLESGDIFTLFNQGTKELTIKKAEFGTANFTTTLAEGDKIAADGAKKFGIRFDALETAATVNDKLTVSFDGDCTVELPVTATALPDGTFYYSFEPNDLEYKWNDDFTMIDADNSIGYMFTTSWVNYSKNGQKAAFSLENDSEDTGMYGMMNPVSGIHALVAASPQSVRADNWLIYRQVTAGSNAAFDFYARNWDTEGTVEPGPQHSVTVLVSEAGNTNTADFTPVMQRTEMPLLKGKEWNHYNVDLSAYAGKKIYIALRHTTDEPSDLSFYDDFTFSDMEHAASGIDGISVLPDDATVEVFNIGGVKVASGKGMSTLDTLAKGLYIVRISDGTSTRTFRIAR